ncbi:MAG TPA: N-acetyltransferase family protein [Bacteroidales bacterium]|nr:N-acetyltransferase family protein [Bacteroidales bacterium]
MMIMIRPMDAADWPDVAEIYRQGIETGHATFEQKVPSWEEWNSRHLEACRFVALSNGQIAGWAALSPVSERCVYAGVAEVSVYVGEKFRGQKIGSRLLEKLIGESGQNGIWTLQAGIFPENDSSIRMHEALGFRRVGYREKIGKMNGRWRDTLLLERRSKTVGI